MSYKFDLIKPTQKILLDADVLSHFHIGESISILLRSFPNEFYIIDIVCSEVIRFNNVAPRLANEVQNLIKFGYLKGINIDDNSKVKIEYAKLKRTLGDGESACLAYCKFHDDVVGSSNLRDIVNYCNSNEITYLTTMDFLYKLFITNEMTEDQCNNFISKVKSNGSRLPYDTIQEYIERECTLDSVHS